jgi:hypothetical protein
MRLFIGKIQRLKNEAFMFQNWRTAGLYVD